MQNKKDKANDTDKIIKDSVDTINSVNEKIEQHLNEMLDADNNIDTAELLNNLETMTIGTIQENANINSKLKLRILQIIDAKNTDDPETLKKIKENNAYNELLIKEFIDGLNHMAELDISHITLYELKKLIVHHNIRAIKYYYEIKPNIEDLYNTESLEANACVLASKITSIQMKFIRDIGYKKFIYTDIDTLINNDFDALLNKELLTLLQKSVRKQLDDYKGKITDADIETVLNLKMNTKIEPHLEGVIVTRWQSILKADIGFYKKVNEYYKEIDQLLNDISNKFKNRVAQLEQEQKLENIKPRVNKSKIPDRMKVNLDLVKFFNNTYILDKEKSIDINAYKKDLDIQATLMLDTNEISIEDIRFSNMIIKELESDKVQLYPIHYALLSGFKDIQEFNNNIDTPILLQDVIRAISDNKKYRLSTNKKLLKTYEDMMLFAKKCRATFRILDNKTGEVLYEQIDPIPLLENYQAFFTNNKEYAYVVGNSFINVFKEVLGKIYGIEVDAKANITSKTMSKAMLNDGQPADPHILNLKWYIYPKIMQMINSINTKQVVKPIINIEPIYKYYANYRDHTEPTDDDRKDARKSINKYLTYLQSKQLIKSFKAIEGKPITQYKIEVYTNQDIKLLKDKKD